MKKMLLCLCVLISSCSTVETIKDNAIEGNSILKISDLEYGSDEDAESSINELVVPGWIWTETNLSLFVEDSGALCVRNNESFETITILNIKSELDNWGTGINLDLQIDKAVQFVSKYSFIVQFPEERNKYLGTCFGARKSFRTSELYNFNLPQIPHPVSGFVYIRFDIELKNESDKIILSLENEDYISHAIETEQSPRFIKDISTPGIF